MEKIKFIDMAASTSESECNVLVVAGGKVSSILPGWLSKNFDSVVTQWLLNEVEISELPWYNIEERIQGLKEIGKLEWIYHVQLTGPSHIAFSERALPSLDY